MNTLRIISTISTITIIALATTFVFMITTTTPALAWHSECPCKYLKFFIIERGRSRSIGENIKLDACTIIAPTFTELSGETRFTVTRLTVAGEAVPCSGDITQPLPPDVFCCQMQSFSATRFANVADTILNNGLSQTEHSDCTRDLNRIASFLGFPCP